VSAPNGSEYDGSVPWLLVMQGPLAGQRLQVESVLVLGRGNADLVIEDPQISRRHALFRAVDDGLEVEDLDSLNGTWVNDTRIDGAAQLAPGDAVRLGTTLLEVEQPAPPLAGPPVVFEPEAREAAQGRPAPALVEQEPGRCPECDASVPSQARFCAYCGVSLRREPASIVRPAPAPALAPAAVPVERAASRLTPPGGYDELRPITALFADVVGSTALGERLPPDEVKALIGECVNRMVRAIEQLGGTIEAYMGDGIAAFFGMPTAHEDDPERAAHAALQILDVVGEYAQDIAAAWGVADFNVRIGVNTGQAAVGVVGGEQQHMVALGDTTNVAARLQSVAAPGTIVVGEATARRLAHRFLLESLGEVGIKGRAQPVSAWRLVRAQTGTPAPAPTPLVGRESEVARLRAAVDELREGRGQGVLLLGEAGIGKTRLLSELHTIAGPGFVWLEGQCRSYGSELLYWPFVEMLRSWLGVAEGEAEVSVRTKLRAKLGSLGALDAAEVLPQLGRLLAVRLESEGAGGADGASAEDGAAEIRRAYGAWIEALGAQQGVVMALDDLHWADPSTRELAESLLDVTDRAPLLLAVAFRADLPSEGSRFRLHALEHYGHRVVELPVAPLSPAAGEELLGMLMPEGLDAAARTELVARAEGNPLYLEELLSTLIEGGGLERRRRTWALTVSPAALPPALESLLVARIDHLDPGPRRLVQIAAVVGRSFPARVLARVRGHEDFERDLGVLVRTQFIRELRRYPELEYTFKHGLLQEAALSTLTPSRRQELYGRVAWAFEELYAGSRDDYLEILAYYYARSDNLPKALEYLEKAGERVAALSGNLQAIELWKRAREVASRLNDTNAGRRITARLDRLV
jgi:class 3 adenylate cyclase